MGGDLQVARDALKQKLEGKKGAPKKGAVRMHAEARARVCALATSLPADILSLVVPTGAGSGW